MKVKLIRYREDAEGTFGVVSIEQTDFACHSIELPWVNNLPNVSCIPPGKYRVEWGITGKHPEGIYVIQNVPGRTFIEFHSGDDITQIEGCILLGYELKMWIGLDELNRSWEAVHDFEAKLGYMGFDLEIIDIT